MSATSPSSLSQRLTLILEPLRLAIASHAGQKPADAPLVLLLWGYLHRVATRFAALTARLAQDRPAAPCAPRTGRPSPAARPPRLPTGFAWLIRLAQETAIFGSQLRHLLADPDMAALLAASPQAGRLLRPVCRMLGIDPGADIPPALFARRAKAASPASHGDPPAHTPPVAHTVPPRYLPEPA